MTKMGKLTCDEYSKTKTECDGNVSWQGFRASFRERKPKPDWEANRVGISQMKKIGEFLEEWVRGK